MQGLMMDFPLTLTHFFERSRRLFGRKGIVTRIRGGSQFRYTLADFADRVRRLAGALRALGVEKGDRVGTYAWNSHRHLELYWAVPLLGSVLHTVNVRLAAAEVAYIINHAGDRTLFVDATLWPQIAAIRPRLRTVRQYVVMADTGAAGPPDVLDYEALVAGAAPVPAWPVLEENAAAAMCYTSGTTGLPKGVVYSHRALFLQCLARTMVDTYGLSERDVILHAVPMFHVNAWCAPFVAVMVGATQVFPGPSPQPRDLAELIQAERVTFVGGVPTVWIAVKEVVEREGFDFSSLRCIAVGGSAVPPRLIEEYERKFGVPMVHAWGMTETAPLGTVSRLKSYMESWPEERRYAMRAKQGYAAVGVDLRVADEAGREVPWDGSTMGELQVRGPWVARAYYDNPDGADQFTTDGWFRTGDVATIDGEGYIQITDRSKDLIKSGGEWISSVDLENLIMAHPKVLEAAVVGVPHPKWLERPLACVVPRPENRSSLTAAEILDFLRPRVAKWWLPDEIVFLDRLPKTSVGKFDKNGLRVRFGRPGRQLDPPD